MEGVITPVCIGAKEMLGLRSSISVFVVSLLLKKLPGELIPSGMVTFPALMSIRESLRETGFLSCVSDASR